MFHMCSIVPQWQSWHSGCHPRTAVQLGAGTHCAIDTAVLHGCTHLAEGAEYQRTCMVRDRSNRPVRRVDHQDAPAVRHEQVAVGVAAATATLSQLIDHALNILIASLLHGSAR